jgi:ATP-dependent Lon protease
LKFGSSKGTGKLRLAGGIEGAMRESIQRAFGYLQSNKVKLRIAREFDTTDFHIEGIDLLQNRASCECGVALIVSMIWAIKYFFVHPALVILGDISLGGHPKPAIRGHLKTGQRSN